MNELKLEKKLLTELKPYEQNVMKHGVQDVDAVKKSIQEYGFNDPIGIWGDDNLIVEGHGRLLALQELGYTEAYCIRLDHLDDKGRKEYAAVHNQTGRNASFDWDMLGNLFSEYPDFDAESFGFEMLSDQTFENSELDLSEPGEYTIKLKYNEHDYEYLLAALRDINDSQEAIFLEAVKKRVPV
jgi:hypothetical protein